MEYDAALAARVWQRVHPETMTEELPSLIHSAAVSAAIYRHLGQNAKAHLAAKQNQIACLQGLHIMETGKRVAISAKRPEFATQNGLLCHCFSRELQALQQYRRHTQDPKYGAVYAQLATEQQALCCQMSRLLGNLYR